MEACDALIIDDEPDIRELIEMTLLPLGVSCQLAGDLATAHALLKRYRFRFCLTDMRLPDGDGLELLAHLQRHLPQLPVAMITAHGNVETAVEALKLGAFDFVSKPIDLTVLRNLVSTALKLSGAPHSGNGAGRPRLLGESGAMADVRKLIAKLARSQAPVLISGDSGTGKELAARLIHDSGPRADKPFVPVNCGAIPAELMESEFFGHKKGSFTGAHQDKPGLFQAAHGGTLFLDEVADLPLHMQVKLLRAIQERAVRQIGAQSETAVDVRILSATHKDLPALVRSGALRQDLYYRLNVIELRMPGLHERPEDIPELAEAVLDRVCEASGLPRPKLAPDAMRALKAYAFPGNVRELENILERASTLCDGDSIGAEDLRLPDHPLDLPAPGQPASGSESVSIDADHNLEGYLEDIEKDVIMKALEATRFNKTAAAEKLGITFRALRYRLKKLGID